jgi:hypothetical protein
MMGSSSSKIGNSYVRGSAQWHELERNYPEERCLAMIRAAILGAADGDSEQ